MINDFANKIVDTFGVEGYIYFRNTMIFLLGALTMALVNYTRVARLFLQIEKNKNLDGIAFIVLEHEGQEKVQFGSPNSFWESYQMLFLYRMYRLGLFKKTIAVRDIKKSKTLFYVCQLALLLIVLCAGFLTFDLIFDWSIVLPDVPPNENLPLN